MHPDHLTVELDPVIAGLLDRHLSASREWFPHELVPYGRGRDAEPGWTWSEADADLGGAQLDQAARSALFINLLTEDNLPYYLNEIDRLFGRDGAWGEWTRRWTAEEGRHSMVIYGYLMVTRAIDPVALERGRMAQVSTAVVPRPDDVRDALVYLSMQELATRIAHRNTGKVIGDSVGYEVMMRVAADENLHHLFYRDAASAALELDPSGVVLAMDRQVCGFAMPGVGIPDFASHAALIARAGIYDLAVHHDQILVPLVLRQWKLVDLEGLSSEAEAARDRLVAHIERTGRIGRRMAERRHADAVQSAGAA
jgi:acyl-[acyl-carrier-protein] desaturase